MLDPLTLLAPRGRISLGVLRSADPRAKGRKAAEAVIEEYVEASYNESRVAAMTVGATQDSAARTYTYYRVYSDAYDAMINRPASLTVAEKGSHTYSSEQIKGMKGLVDQYLAEFEAIVVEPETETAQPAVPPTSARVCLSF